MNNISWGTIPETDIMGEPLNIGDEVVVFNKHFISYEKCYVTEKNHEDEKKRALQVDDYMWFFGLGNHEVLKIV